MELTELELLGRFAVDCLFAAGVHYYLRQYNSAISNFSMHLIKMPTVLLGG